MERIRYGVFPHSINRESTGRGYVVRQCDSHGRATDTYNYGGVNPIRVFLRQEYAQRFAEELLNRQMQVE